LEREGSLALNTQINPGYAIIDRRAEQLVDEGHAVRALVFDCEDAAVRKNTDGQAGAILDPSQAEITVARRRPPALA